MTFRGLESRDNIGGTWDLFKYPGVRTDSDMYTYAYEFKPWLSPKQFASAQELLAYLGQVVDENDLRKFFTFGSCVLNANFSSEENLWTVTTSKKHRSKSILQTYTSRFVIFGTGYYDYSSGYTPDLPGLSDFKGTVIHPQFWPTGDGSDEITANKKIIVIGSGATAVTVIPELAKTAQQVTMLQRSPSYIVGDRKSMLCHWRVTQLCIDCIPGFRFMYYKTLQYVFIFLALLFYNACIMFPKLLKRGMLKKVKEAVGDEHMKNFTPHYNPWEQRVCFAPDGDFHKSITRKNANVNIVTDSINKITKNGIELQSGTILNADVIVTATVN